MKKFLSLVLCILLCITVVPAATAGDLSHIELAVCFYNSVFYVRFDPEVFVTEDALHVTYRSAAQAEPMALDDGCIQLYTGDRLEIVMQFPNQIHDLTVFGLALNDQTALQTELRVKDYEQIDRNDMERVWSDIKRDALYTPQDVTSGYDSYVAVGSRWKVDLSDESILNDPYLAAYASLESDEIELQQDGGDYVFAQTGEGKVSLCWFGISLLKRNVGVLPKESVKRKMILNIPLTGFLTCLAFTRLLGPFAFPISFAYAIIYSIEHYIRLIFV